jgi:hypothetical protein
MKELLFMGEPDAREAFRGRIYAAEDPHERDRRAFLENLADGGVLDCEAFDTWTQALAARGWISSTLVPHPDVAGAKAKLWTLTDYGRAEWARVKEQEQ